MQELKKQMKGAKAVTDSSEPLNEKQQHTPIDLGFIEELLRDAGLLRGSGLDQLFTTVGARGLPLVTGVVATETPLVMRSGTDKLSNLDDEELDAADRTGTILHDVTEHD